MNPTLGGTTLPKPVAGEEGHRITAIDVGGEMEMADGSVRVHHVGTRRRFDLEWRGLTSTERNTLWTKYGVKTAQTYTTPESGSSFTVVVVRNSWEESSVNDVAGTFYYNVKFALQEQAAS